MKELIDLLMEDGRSEAEAREELHSLKTEFHWLDTDTEYPCRVWWVEDRQEFRVAEQSFIPPHLL